MLNFGDGTNVHLLFEVDGAVDLDDRLHLLDLYSGIAAASPTLGGDLQEFDVQLGTLYGAGVQLLTTFDDDVQLGTLFTEDVEF